MILKLLSYDALKTIHETTKQIVYWKKMLQYNILRQIYYDSGIYTKEEYEQIKKKKRKEIRNKIKKYNRKRSQAQNDTL